MIPQSETRLPKSMVGGFMNTSESKRPAAKRVRAVGSPELGPPLWRQSKPYNTPRPPVPSPIDHEFDGASLGQGALALDSSPMRPPCTRSEQGVAQGMWHLVAIAHVLAAAEVPTPSPPADPPSRKPGTLPRERQCLDK